MKRRILTVLLPLSLFAGSANAVDLACGAYLCSFVGFVAPGCSAVRVAMFKRMWHFPPKSPVPSWNSCISESKKPDFSDYSDTLSPQEQADALTMVESMTETADVYKIKFPRAYLIYEKTWNPVKGGSWENTPNLDRPPRIVQLEASDDSDSLMLNQVVTTMELDLNPLYPGGPPWMKVAKLKGLQTFKNGEQYGPTHFMNSYGRNFYDNKDYNQNPVTLEIEAFPLMLDTSSYMTPEQIEEDAAQLEAQRLELESAGDPVSIFEPEPADDPVSTVESEQPAQSDYELPESINNDIADGMPEGNDELLDNLRESMGEPAPEGIDPAEWQAYLQAAIDALEE